MSDIVFLNGKFLSNDEAKISPNDRGFIFADGVYEVVKYYNGKPFRLKDHIDRLKNSLEAIGLDYNVEDCEKIFDKLIKTNKFVNKHGGVYCQITRGVEKRTHHFPVNSEPTIYAYAFDLSSFTEKLNKGIKVITHEDIRWLRCDIKSVSLLPNTMLYNKAFENGAGECILIRKGIVTEATHSSVIGVKDGVVITHPLSNLVLPGITRKVVQEICNENKILFLEKKFTSKELFEIDELMIVGTGSEITPVIQVNDYLTGNGKPGEITQFIQQKFFEMV